MLAERGFRAIAIDLIGMGRSDKPTRMQDYSIARHVAWVQEALFQRLGLRRCHVILHDWGGIIGLRAIADHQERIISVVMSNTGLPVRNPDAPIERMARPGAGMLRAFQLYVRFRRNWQHWKMLRRIVLSSMPDADVAGFAAPYPDRRFLTGNRQFAQMLPTRNDNPMLTDNGCAAQAGRVPGAVPQPVLRPRHRGTQGLPGRSSDSRHPRFRTRDAEGRVALCWKTCPKRMRGRSSLFLRALMKWKELRGD